MNQTSIARATAVLGLLLAAGPALADTFSVEASGTPSWPLIGGTLVMSPSAIRDVTGTLRDEDPATADWADYVLRAGPGIVALSQSGAYTPGLTGSPMQPTTTAAADSSVVFTGPGANVSTQVFVDVSGRFEVTCPTAACGEVASDITVSLYGASTSVSIGRSAPLPGQEGTLTVDRSVPGVVSFSGRLASPVVAVPTGVSLPVSVDATLDADIPPSASNAIWGANLTANFPTQGPAFDLPAGFSANGSDLVDNAWTVPSTITTVAGGGIVYGNGGQATSAQLGQPLGIAVDANGNIFFADYDLFVVRRVDGATGTITTIAGVAGQLDIFGGDGDGGPATSATLGTPIGVSLDGAGNVYLSDDMNSRMRKVDAANGIITTVAGDGGVLFGGDGGLATQASIANPQGVAHDSAGNMYIADTANFRVRKVNTSGIITTIAGTGLQSSSGDGGPATSASFASPRRVTVDGVGNVFVLDVAGTTARIRRIATNGIITTIAGGGSDGTSGSPTGANLSGAADVDVDASGNVFIAGASRAWKATLATNSISSVAGTGVAGFSGDGGDATLAALNGLGGITVAGDGAFWISDAGNHRVRKVLPDAAPPPPPPPPPVFDGTITLTTSQGTLDGLTSFTGSVSLVNVAGYTNLTLPNLTGVTVDFTVSGNPNLALVSTPVLSAVGGSLTVSNNPVLTTADLSSVTSVSGSVAVTNDPSLASVNLTGLDSAGAVVVSDNSSASSITVGSHVAVVGDVSVANNVGAGSVAVTADSSSSVTISGNTAATTVDVSSSTTAGSVTVIDNPSAAVTLGAGSVGGDLTVETTGSTVNYSTVTTGGSVDVTGVGTTTLSATTGGLDTSVTLLNAEATMQAFLPTGSTAGAVGFSITHQNPSNLPLTQGVDFTNTTVNVDPVAAYSFNFAIPTLNSDATLVFDIDVAALDPASRSALLTALADGLATLAVKNDAVGSLYQTFAVCSGSAVPTDGGCVSVAKLDADGLPTTGTPATVRFTGVVGHFSTYAVVVVSAIAPPPPPPGAIVIDSIAGPLEPLAVGTVVNMSATFSGSVTSASWNWGDGATTAGTIVPGVGGGAVSGSHAYTMAAVYPVTLTLTDGSGSVTDTFNYVVVYDPSAGYVTGGGWYNSPAGAIVASPSVTTRAEFGFVARYKKGTSTPIGEAEFKLEGDAIKLVSTSYQWLVVSGARAQFKGVGKVNDQTGYSFIITAIDGQLTGGGGVDKLRVKIWRTSGGQVVYDNQIGASDTANPTTALGGGQIKIKR